jgi:ribonuclease P protein component
MLPRKNRISSKLFPMVTKGKNITTENARISIKQDTTLAEPKCAVIVSHKQSGSAVVRNTVRRRYYESLGKIIHSLPNAYICIFPKNITTSVHEIVKEIEHVFLKK